jgi:hypothetical protein
VFIELIKNISFGASSLYEEKPMANGSGSEVFDDGDGFSGDTESVATVSRFFGRSSLKEMVILL